MYTHRLVISYKGRDYYGWQDLGVSNQKATIQASIQDVLNKICKYQNSTISVASRTDAGVHAQGQVVKITIPIEIQSHKLLLGINSLLADDIRILECQPCGMEFNPNKHSISKEYHYYFDTASVYNPLLNDIVTHTGILEIKSMQEACKIFLGKHDFYSFAKRDNTMTSTLRTISTCEILKLEASPFVNTTYYLKIIGTGFLRYMVRYIVGALFELGRYKLILGDISDALAHHKEEKISAKAKAKGLHLIEISY